MGSLLQPLAVGLMLLCSAALAAAASPKVVSSLINAHKSKHPFSSPHGLFIQERASKQLPGPGQHFSFGALVPWEDIHKQVHSGRKLVLLVRHGQAISNFLSDTLGPDIWYTLEETCAYDDKNGTIYEIFDARLTGTGHEQTKALNSMLKNSGWFDKLTAGKAVRVVVSPLSRCLQTCLNVMDGLAVNATNVEEYVRETLGEDTCDARHSVSDPESGLSKKKKPDHKGDQPCDFQQGLASMFPQFQFPVLGKDKDDFGLVSDEDTMWAKDDREKQGHQVRRATEFLYTLFERAEEEVVFVVTHSGFARSVLLAVGREPYRPVNAELVPIIVEQLRERSPEDDEGLLAVDKGQQ